MNQQCELTYVQVSDVVRSVELERGSLVASF